MKFVSKTSIKTVGKDLEVILIAQNQECVENTMKILKASEREIDVFWIRDPQKALQFIESKGPYEGKLPTNKTKVFVYDSRFGIAEYMSLFQILQEKKLLEDNPLCVLAKHADVRIKAMYQSPLSLIIDENFTSEQIFEHLKCIA